MGERAILVGDAGGTNVRFALARVTGESVALSQVWKRRGADFPSFDAALGAFLSETTPQLSGKNPARFSGACLGLAGQEKDGRVELLNRGWTVDIARTTAMLLTRILVVNDFVAMARSAPELSATDVREIAPGDPDVSGSLAIGGPGTGFGIAVMRPSDQGWIVVGGEGGHQAFAPQTETEWKLADRLRKHVGYVSNEFVAAGAGFTETLEALSAVMGVAPRKLSPAEVVAQAKTGDPLSLEFCRIRAATVMTAMGDLALACNATGGVFIAGGVAQHLEPWLREKAALDRFYQRGPRTGLMAPIPIKLIASEQAPLIGAAQLWLDEQARGWL
jgi:glucokinase